MIAAIRQTRGGYVYWLIMTLVFVAETAVLGVMGGDPWNVVKYICLAVFVLVGAMSGFIAGVKIHDHIKQQASRGDV